MRHNFAFIRSGIEVFATLTYERAEPDVGWEECKHIDDLQITIVSPLECEDEWGTTNQKELEEAVRKHIERNFDSYAGLEDEPCERLSDYLD
jgi:hypothetical protein